MLRRRRKRDEGFTLIELMLSISILGVLMAALVGLLFATITADSRTKERLDGTRAEQFSAVYFGSDVQGATEVAQGQPARCGSGTAVVELRGVTHDPMSLNERVTISSYVFTTAVVDGATVGRLERRTCEAPASGVTYPLSPARTLIVARDLGPSAPSLSCPAACTATSKSMTLTVSRNGADSPFTIVGTRRPT
jgi:prepilin-type N-terminal cleavage/methylation domain-containing protein